MDINNAFDIITGKFEKTVSEKGYVRETVAESENEKTALFVGDAAYSIVYTYSDKRMMLRSCGVSDGEPDNNWKIIATWLFDPESDGAREAESIGDDFSETVKVPKQMAAAQKQKKKKKDNEGNVDPLFLANRMVAYLPELNDDIAYEMAHYEEFRGITFAEEKIDPDFKEMVKSSGDGKLEKLSEVLANLYNAGDLDTKGIITYDMLNSIDSDDKFMKLISAFPDSDKKIAKAARKLIGKKLKPEKPKKKSKFIAADLNS